MSLQTKSLNVSKYIYELAFSLVIIDTYLSCSEMSLHLNFHLNDVLLLCSLLLFIKIIIDNHKVHEYIIIGLIIIISVIITHFSQDATIIVDVLLVIGAKNENFIRLMKIFFYIGSILTSIFILGALLGVLSNVSRVGHAGMRYALGFSYPVELSESVLILSIIYSIIHFYKISWIRLLVYSLLAYFIIKIPNTRMDYYCMFILIFIDFIEKICPRILNKFPFNLSWLSLSIMSFLSVYFAMSYNKLINTKFFYNMNYILENRLYYSSYWLTKFPKLLFGRNMKIYYNTLSIDGIGKINGYIDQSIIHLVVNYGWIIFIVFLFIYTIKMFQLHKLNLNYYVLLFMIIVIRGFSDINLLQLFGNPFLVLVFANLNEVKHMILFNKDYNNL